MRDPANVTTMPMPQLARLNIQPRDPVSDSEGASLVIEGEGFQLNHSSFKSTAP